MAQSLIGPAVLMAWAAAPVPRAPQPMSPTLISSLPAACAVRAMRFGKINAAPAPSAEVERNCLRLEVEEVEGLLFVVFMMPFSLATADGTCKLAR